MAYTPYQPYDWETGEVITEGKLDHIEEGLVAAGEQIAENESDIAELNEQMQNLGLSTINGELNITYFE